MSNLTQAWLEDQTSIRCLLVEITARDIVANTEVVFYLSNIGYNTSGTTSIITYLPYLNGSIQTTEALTIDGGLSMSFGDIEVANNNGELDAWLDSSKYVWANRGIQIYLGDPRWDASSLTNVHTLFEKIFDGVVADIDSSSRESINIKVRDKLDRLNYSVTDNKLGTYGSWGSAGQSNQDAVRTLVFGEVNNISPLLISQLTKGGEYLFNDTNTITTITATNSTTNELTCTSTVGMVPNKPITFSIVSSGNIPGALFGGLSNLIDTYYIRNITSPTTFTLQTGNGSGLEENFGTDCLSTDTSNVYCANTSGFTINQPIVFSGSGIPSPLVAGTVYYVQNIFTSTNSITVTTVASGSIITLTVSPYTGTTTWWVTQNIGTVTAVTTGTGILQAETRSAAITAKCTSSTTSTLTCNSTKQFVLNKPIIFNTKLNPIITYSALFNGTSQYLTLANNALLALSAAFTIEAWVYPTATSQFTLISLTGTNTLQIFISANKLYFYDSATIQTSGTGTVPLNAWTHIAVQRFGQWVTGYINGVLSFTTSYTTAFTQGTNYIGWNGGASYAKGYISNLRILKFATIYTGSNFTVPVSPPTAITNTSLLTFQNNTFVDNSGNNIGITAMPSVSPPITTSNVIPVFTVPSGSTGIYSGLSDGVSYYIKTIPTTTTFTVSDSLISGVAGPEFLLTTGTDTIFAEVIHSGTESIIEIRDNGLPIYTNPLVYSGTGVRPSGALVNNATGKFTLISPPVGTITASIQGVKRSVNIKSIYASLLEGVYINNANNIIALIATQYGNPSGRLSYQDLDLDNLNSYSTTSSTLAISGVSTVVHSYVSGTTESTITLTGTSMPIYSAYIAVGDWVVVSGLVHSTLSATINSPVQILTISSTNITLRLPNTISTITSITMSVASTVTLTKIDWASVGIAISDRVNVLSILKDIAVSIGGQIFFNRSGKLQLLKLGTPTSDAVISITDSDILHHSLHISKKTEVIAATKVGYCLNYTTQTALSSILPSSANIMFSDQWYSTTISDSAVQTLYRLESTPVQLDTKLISGRDAVDLATRLNNYFKVPRTVYAFTGTSKLMYLKLGQSVTLTHNRFGLNTGKTGQVITLSPDWALGTINVEVII